MKIKRLYDQNDLLFALLWIGAYCTVSIPIRGMLGDESPAMLAGLGIIAAGLWAFVRGFHLEERYGLVKWKGAAGTYLFFFPMLFLATGNLWGGVKAAYGGASLVRAVFSMMLVGFIEELIFRGFLFRALLKREAASAAIIISAVTFGAGHLVNLLTGQGGLASLVQVIFAIAWGFLFTFVFYKSGSLWLCIVVHGLVDVFSKFAASDGNSDSVYTILTVIISAAYCIYLKRRPTALSLK